MADVKINEGLRVETKLLVGDISVTPTATLHLVGEGNTGSFDNLFYFSNSDGSDSLEMNNAGRVTMKSLNSIPFQITRPNGNGIMQFRNDANEGSVTYYGDSMPRWGSGVIETEFNNFHYVFGYSPTVSEGGNSPADLPNMNEVMRMKHNGQIVLAQYVGTDQDDTPVKSLGVTADGSVVTSTSSGGDLEDALAADNNSGEYTINMTGANTGKCRIQFSSSTQDTHDGRIGSDSTAFHIGTTTENGEFQIRMDTNAYFYMNSDGDASFNSSARLGEARVVISDSSQNPFKVVADTATTISNADVNDGLFQVSKDNCVSLNTQSSKNVTLSIAATSMENNTPASGTINPSNSSVLFSASGADLANEFSVGDVILVDNVMYNFAGQAAVSLGYFSDPYAGSTTTGLSYSKLGGSLFSFKDAAGKIKFKMTQGGNISLGINPTEQKSSWFFIDTNANFSSSSVYSKAGIHLSNPKSGMQIGGADGDIGSEGILIDNAATNDSGILFRTDSGDDIHLLQESQEFTIKKGTGGSAKNVFRITDLGIIVGTDVGSNDAEAPLHVEGDAMIDTGKIILDSTVSASSTTGAWIMTGAYEPDFGTNGNGIAAPKGTLFINTAGIAAGQTQTFLYVKTGTGDQDWKRFPVV